MNKEIEMPATVAAYLQDPAVRTAVEALLEVDSDVLPPGLEFDELDTYYRARGGAELTRHDMAHLLRQLWKRIWGGQIGPHWQPAPLEEVVEEEYAITPDVIWEEKSFTVYHSQGPYVLFTDVKVEPHALSIAFSVENEEEGVLIRNDHAHSAGATTKNGPAGRSPSRSAIRKDRSQIFCHLWKRRHALTQPLRQKSPRVMPRDSQAVAIPDTGHDVAWLVWSAVRQPGPAND